MKNDRKNKNAHSWMRMRKMAEDRQWDEIARIEGFAKLDSRHEVSDLLFKGL